MRTEAIDLTNMTQITPKCTESLMIKKEDKKMILTRKEEKLGKSEAVYQLLLKMNEKYSKYLINIWDMKNQNDTIDLAHTKEILFFEDAIVILSKKEYGMFINLDHVMSIDLVIKEAKK